MSEVAASGVVSGLFRAVAAMDMAPRRGSFRVRKGDVCYLRETFPHRKLGTNAPFFDGVAAARQDAATMISGVPRDSFTGVVSCAEVP